MVKEKKKKRFVIGDNFRGAQEPHRKCQSTYLIQGAGPSAVGKMSQRSLQFNQRDEKKPVQDKGDTEIG